MRLCSTKHLVHRFSLCAQVDYYTFVSSITDFDAIPRAQRLGRSFREYLQVGQQWDWLGGVGWLHLGFACSQSCSVSWMVCGRQMGQLLLYYPAPSPYPCLTLSLAHQALVAYLESFYERTQPLSQLARQYDKVRLWGRLRRQCAVQCCGPARVVVPGAALSLPSLTWACLVWHPASC